MYDHGLGHVGLNEGGRVFLGSPADFPDHHDGFRFRILLEQLQDIDKVAAGDRVSANTHASGLAIALSVVCFTAS